MWDLKRMKNFKRVKTIVLFMVLLIFLLPYDFVSAAEEDNYYTILLKETDNYNDVVRLAEKNNIEVVYSIEELGLLQVKGNEEKVKVLGENSLIDTYNPSLRTLGSKMNMEKEMETNLQGSLWDKQWDMHGITNNGESYKIYSGSKNVTVGIIDSGLDMEHPDLKNNIVGGSKNLVPKNGFRGKERDESGDSNELTDKLGHGTHVAGQIAANGKLKGVAPNVGIKSYRVFGERTAESLWIVKGIIEAAKDDVDVINVSLGDYLIDGVAYLEQQGSKTNIAEIKAFKDAIQYAEEQGSIVVAAAGNNSLDVNDKDVMYKFLQKKLRNDGIKLDGELLDVPASLPGVVTVSSIGPSKELSLFSNFGDGFIDIAAPGGDNRLFKQFDFNIWDEQKMYEKEKVISTGPDQDYFYDAGNSTAAPKVSGALALIVGQRNLKDKPNQAVEYLYKWGVDPVENKRSLFGNGILNVYKVVNS
ncbi:S8 family serine peptidase (plasmid) [Bacillus tropicus]|uniref:S8 family peptidase n=1 Tax=Bacillus tropicus TaxID=2026188 RepID=UPI001123FC1B|nr:S8 family serine peptidase [Bacillus tropicus]TNP12949.1 peptidase S8 [Bacillus tropicus]UOK49432.1 S8 family serine peptidase [Bacillus tropicus]